METLLPLRSSLRAGGQSRAITVLVNRRISSAEEKTFLTTLNGLLDAFDHFPGTAGSMVFRRETGGSVEFSILQQFNGPDAHDAWVASEEFSRWRSAVAPSDLTPDHVRRYSGMESFFVSAKAPDAPPRWKMAVLLLVVVYPLTLAISTWGAPALSALPELAGSFLTSVFMVWLMTYVLVPILTRIFQPWLQSAGRPAEKTSSPE